MVGGGWETLDMLVRYTVAVKFEDSPKVYEGAKKGSWGRWVRKMELQTWIAF